MIDSGYNVDMEHESDTENYHESYHETKPTKLKNRIVCPKIEKSNVDESVSLSYEEEKGTKKLLCFGKGKCTIIKDEKHGTVDGCIVDILDNITLQYIKCHPMNPKDYIISIGGKYNHDRTIIYSTVHSRKIDIEKAQKKYDLTKNMYQDNRERFNASGIWNLLSGYKGSKYLTKYNIMK